MAVAAEQSVGVTRRMREFVTGGIEFKQLLPRALCDNGVAGITVGGVIHRIHGNENNRASFCGQYCQDNGIRPPTSEERSSDHINGPLPQPSPHGQPSPRRHRKDGPLWLHGHPSVDIAGFKDLPDQMPVIHRIHQQPNRQLE
jgi:hypothetical protein